MGVILLRPTGGERPDVSPLGVYEGVYEGTVQRVEPGPCMGAQPEDELICRRLVVRVDEGPDAGRTVEMELPANAPRIASVDRGDEVLLGHQPEVEAFEYVFLEPLRRTPLLALALLFAIAVVLLGRLRGLTALIGLAATLAMLALFVLPAILDGRSPLLVALVGASAISFLALYLSHGFHPKTTVAVLGTLGGLACTAALAAIFMSLASITGFTSEEAFVLQALGAEIEIRGLILGGVVIGALGAIDDMTVTQASAVWELRAANPRFTRRQLVRSGMRIGRDHVASTVNTLVLAYAGASMPLLILFVLSRQSVGVVLNSEILATEVVRTLVGSIGLVASVPITTLLAARAAVAGPVRRKVGPPPGPAGVVAPPPGPDGVVAPPESVGVEEEPPVAHPIPERRWQLWRGWLTSRRR